LAVNKTENTSKTNEIIDDSQNAVPSAPPIDENESDANVVVAQQPTPPIEKPTDSQVLDNGKMFIIIIDV
jgi:hypothetical protein